MLYDKVDSSLAAAALFFSFIALLFDCISWAILLCFLYVAGVTWGMELISFIQNTYITHNGVSNLGFKNKVNLCKVCGSNQCKTHRLSTHMDSTPKVPKTFDAALETLLEELLLNYVCTWYSNLSSNKAFIQQLRLAISSAAKNITNRLYKADISGIIFNNLIPVGIRHAQDWKELTQRSKELGGTPLDHVTNYIGSKIHPAAYSREAELNYLRALVTKLLPHLLPITHISTNNRVILREVLANWVLLPAMDALCNPDNLNLLVSLCTHHEGNLSDSIDALDVPLLQAWISKPQSIPNDVSLTFKPTLEEILNDPELLYMFMQHIKDSGLVTLLQFCLDIDDLSKRMLNPDMTSAIEENLYEDACKIYSSYLDPQSSNFLSLPAYISQGLKQILDGGAKKIQELRTSKPLYEAHQEAHLLLENSWLPSFHHTYQLYKHLCGTQFNNSVVKPTTQISSSIGVGARLTTQLGKIRGVLKASAVDGSPFQTQNVYQVEEGNCIPRIRTEGPQGSLNRDLTTWRVTVPHVDGGGAQPLYMISVHSVLEDKSWTVLRRDQDFYALRAKLSEFHGDKELNDSPLPTRKNPNASLTSNRQCYQDFLQKLIAKPTLKSSELLHTFFTVPNLKPYFTNYNTPDIGILYQSMAHKLRKEKGQHLDKFMTSFLSSTHIKDDMDIGVELVGDHRFQEQVKRNQVLSNSWPFKNNLSLDSQIQNFPYVVNKLEHAKGATFCIAEAVTTLVEVPSTLSQLLWVLSSMLHKNVDPIINKCFYDLVIKLLSDGRAALVVQLLQEVIFEDEESKNTNLRSEKFYKEAKEGLHNILPWWLSSLHFKWCNLMDALLEPLQNAPFNKHLAYVLVDQLLVNLFPEIV